MSKTIKHTRARALPAKIQLSQQQDLTGSFPSISRTPSDNRTGRYPIVFHDNSTIRFNQKTDSVVYPLLLTPQAGGDILSHQNILDNTYSNGESPIITSGSMVRSVSDIFAERKDYCQQSINFNDYANPEVDAKKTENSFYSTGSMVSTTGEGFQQPLWSKNKITIDMTPSSEHTVTLNPTNNNCYPTMYWNNSRKRYEGIGNGKSIYGNYSSDMTGLREFLEEQVFAFGTSMDYYDTTIPKSFFNVYARQISVFGFPYHPKFQTTSSQQINMSDYISEPFLLEKIVFETSAALKIEMSSNTDSAIWTFFLLNTRSTIPNISIGSQDITPFGVNSNNPFVTSSISSKTYLDLVDYFQVAFTGSYTFGSPTFQNTDRELSVDNTRVLSSPTSYIFNGQMQISSSVKTSIGYTGVYTNFSNYYVRQDLFTSGRNQIADGNGRDWINSFEKPQIIGIQQFNGAIGYPEIPVNYKYTKPNPYILLPSDKLTIGCQLPWTIDNSNYQDISSSISFSNNGINKIILYGSTLRVNPETNQLEEYHDSLNQILTSESVHENLG